MWIIPGIMSASRVLTNMTEQGQDHAINTDHPTYLLSQRLWDQTQVTLWEGGGTSDKGAGLEPSSKVSLGFFTQAKIICGKLDKKGKTLERAFYFTCCFTDMGWEIKENLVPVIREKRLLLQLHPCILANGVKINTTVSSVFPRDTRNEINTATSCPNYLRSVIVCLTLQKAQERRQDSSLVEWSSKF